MSEKFKFINGAEHVRQVCDNCHISKKKCDKGSPCERCKSKGIECIINRQLKVNKRMRNDSNFLSQIFISEKSSSVKKKHDKEYFKASNLTNKVSSNTFGRKKALNLTFLAATTLSAYRLKIYPNKNLLPSFKIPSLILGLVSNKELITPEFSWQDLLALFKAKPLLCTDKFLNSAGLIEKEGNAVLPNLDPEIQLLKLHHNLYSKGIDAFFKYHNKFIPLFTQARFHAVERPPFLKLAVWLCGVNYLNHDSSVEVITYSVKAYLNRMIKENVNKPTLALLQTLCICNFGIRRYKYSLEPFKFNNVLNMAYQLGLHLEPTIYRLNEELMIERCLTFNYILSYHSSMDIHVTTENDHYKWNLAHLLQNIDNLVQSNTYTIANKIETNILLIASDFRYRSMFVYYKLFSIYSTDCTTRDIVDKIQLKLYYLRIEFKDILMGSLKKLHKIKRQCMEHGIFNLQEDIEVLIASIMIQSGSDHISTFSNKFYLYEAKPKLNISLPTKTFLSPTYNPADTDLSLARDYCNKIFYYNSWLGNRPVFKTRAYAVFKALNFLIETYYLHEQQALPLIVVGLENLERFKTIQIYSKSYLYCLELIQKLLLKNNIRLPNSNTSL